MNLKEYIQSEIKSQISEAKDMTFVDYLKVLDSKFLDGMKADLVETMEVMLQLHQLEVIYYKTLNYSEITYLP